MQQDPPQFHSLHIVLIVKMDLTISVKPVENKGKMNIKKDGRKNDFKNQILL